VGERPTDFFIETLVGADDEGIRLLVGGAELAIPYRLIARANLEFEFNTHRRAAEPRQRSQTTG
jgi:hypothetical protein